MPDRPRFLADAMLGTLARWLRILGLDVEYDADVDDAELVEKARAENRVILTRDRRLVERRRARRWVLIRSDPLEEQLAQVIDELALELPADDLMRRCLDCNRTLEPIPAEVARRRVPPFVARTQDRFRRCPSCGRVFWRATHVEAIEKRLSGLGIELGTPTTSRRLASEESGPARASSGADSQKDPSSGNLDSERTDRVENGARAGKAH